VSALYPWIETLRDYNVYFTAAFVLVSLGSIVLKLIRPRGPLLVPARASLLILSTFALGPALLTNGHPQAAQRPAASGGRGGVGRQPNPLCSGGIGGANVTATARSCPAKRPVPMPCWRLRLSFRRPGASPNRCGGRLRHGRSGCCASRGRPFFDRCDLCRSLLWR